MEEHRPDPDALLAAIQKEEGRERRGKLKIFFGMAAGVGKTYAMLQAAHERQAEGVDVVIGYIETHRRAETDALLEGLPIIPRQRAEYRSVALEEMDLDAVLARCPQLVLVDELAHTNAPGTRHPKRYQDVLELLDAGMDVYTTLNVQHLESRADAVQQIAGVLIRETIPDSLLETASTIELIDLAPDELRKRLAEGKVYVPEQAELATRQFFRLGNLTALREMALRVTAERVDHQLRDYMTVKQIAGPWKSGERLMVAVDASPLSERLVRWTRRMAYNLEAPWMAVHVETSRTLSADEKTQLARNLALARELGAEVVTTANQDIPAALLRLARQHNVTQIVVGKPLHSWWQGLGRGGPLVNRLVRNSGYIDICVVTGDRTETAAPPPRFRLQSAWSQYALALLIVAGATGVNLLLLPFVDYHAVALVLLFAIAMLALFLGRGPTLLAAALSALVWDFLFIPPRFTIWISKLEDVLMLGMYFVIAFVTGTLTARLRGQEQASRHREERTEALYALSRGIASAVTMDDVLRTAMKEIGQVFAADLAVLLPDSTGKLASQPHPASTLTMDEKELSVAAWVFAHRKPAGHLTDTLPMAEARYLPLLTPSGAVGVLGIRRMDSIHMRRAEHLTPDQETLLETFAGQMALAIEREMLDAAAEHAALLAESERLHKTLLNSVSHELRTPIAAIAGAASSLLDPQMDDRAEARRALAQDIQAAAERLNRLVTNLLDMTRLGSGLLKPRLDWVDVGDLVNAALRRVKPFLAQHTLIMDVAPNLPLAQMDFTLMEQALANLLHNAAVHTPPGTRVRISAQVDEGALALIVADRGPGLPEDALERIFDKFYRVPGAAAGGTGLGLSIVRGLVEAHGGTVKAENRANGGARFIIRLPLQPPPPPPPPALMAGEESQDG